MYIDVNLLVAYFTIFMLEIRDIKLNIKIRKTIMIYMY